MQGNGPVPVPAGHAVLQPRVMEAHELNVRWRFIENNRLNELCLINADELEVSVVEQEFKPKGVLLADYFGDAMNWSKFEFEFESSQVDLSSMDMNAGDWHNGISVNTDKC
jgi:hypothetical protein